MVEEFQKILQMLEEAQDKDHKDGQDSGDSPFFYGEWARSLDAKGRAILPNEFREAIGEYFYLIRDNEDGCITIYQPGTWNSIARRMKDLPRLGDLSYREASRFFMGGSFRAEVDRQGRFLIPEALRKRAGLVKDITMVGIGDKIEIWDQETWNNRSRSTGNDLADSFRGMGV